MSDNSLEDLIKKLKKASKILLKEDKNYQYDSSLKKLIEAANIIKK